MPVSESLTLPYFQKAMSIPNIDMIVVIAHIGKIFIVCFIHVCLFYSCLFI